MEFKSNFGTYKVKINENPNYLNTLKQVYGDKIKKPRGISVKAD